MADQWLTVVRLALAQTTDCTYSSLLVRSRELRQEVEEAESINRAQSGSVITEQLTHPPTGVTTTFHKTV